MSEATAAVVNPLVAQMGAAVTELINENNARAERLRSAGNSAALVHEVRDEKETDDARILKYRDDMEKANAEILRWQEEIEKYIRESGLVSVEPVDVDKETEAWKALHAQIKPMLTVMKNIGGDDSVNDLPEIKGIPGRGNSVSSAPGTPKPRVQRIRYQVAGSDAWVEVSKEKETDDGNKVNFTNLTVLSQALNKAYKGAGVSASDLQGPMFDAAGTKDLSVLNGKPVQFGFSVGGEKPANLIVEVTPRVS
jgi:hypothetical protein